jgi:putative transposase
LECAPLQIGGVEDHVHILCGLSRKISLAELVKNLKTSSTRILKGKGHDGFSWQSGYGAFSVSQSAKESVFSYIAEQEIHHRRMKYQDEFRALLNKHGIRFDERYVWDGLRPLAPLGRIPQIVPVSGRYHGNRLF